MLVYPLRVALVAAALFLPAADAAAQTAPRARDEVVTTSDSVRLSVKIAGHGPPVLFLHGGPGQGTLSFEKMGGSALEEFATVIYLDQRGSGRSDSAADYHLERMVRDIEEVRARLGYDKVFLLAHSFGGILAVNYAAQHPEHVAGLVLAATTVHFRDEALLAHRIEFVSELLGRPAPVTPSLGRDSLLALEGSARRALNASGLGYRLLTDSVAPIETMTAIDRSYPRTIDFGRSVMQEPETYPEYYRDYSELTRRITAPVLVIAATRDHAIGPDHYRTFRFPHQQVVQIDSGHLIYYDRTVEFAAAVRGFLRTHDN